MDEKRDLEQVPNIEDLSGIRRELEEIWETLGDLRIVPQFVGIEPGHSGDAMPEEDLLPFEARLRRARDAGDMLTALRIKQEAAVAGVVLL